VNKDVRARVWARGGRGRHANDETGGEAITLLTRGLLLFGGVVTRCVASFQCMSLWPDSESRALRARGQRICNVVAADTCWADCR
jgi:hypothetical protein